MNKVIVLYASPSLKENSLSYFFYEKYLNEYKLINPDDEFKFYDLNELPMANKTLNSNNFATFFNQTDSLDFIKELKESNKLIIVTSMINFNIPATLKNFIDHICMANETFSYKYSNKGDAIGLLKNLKLQVIATQGAPEDWYLWGNHVKYLEETFKFLGLNVNKSILIAGTKTKEFALKSKEEHWLFKKEEIIEKVKKF